MFRRPTRSRDDLQIKVRFWQTLCKRPDSDHIEIEYLLTRRSVSTAGNSAPLRFAGAFLRGCVV